MPRERETVRSSPHRGPAAATPTNALARPSRAIRHPGRVSVVAGNSREIDVEAAQPLEPAHALAKRVTHHAARQSPAG